MGAFAAEHQRQRPLRFAKWWQQYEAIIGQRDAFSLARLLEQLEPEIALTGLKDESQHFLFIAARCRMPEMGNRQYLEVLDVLVADMADEDKLRAFDAIATRISADA